jgi:CDP-6-deoxy-D-xylo-4-hexulose-3-dehydrase
MNTPYKLAADTIGKDEIAAAKQVLDSMHLTMGARVQAFEEQFAAWTGGRYALMVNSGSTANLVMAEALMRRSSASAEWKRGDEVIVPALSWPTTVWPIVQLGLTPVFVDVDSQTLAINLASAHSVLTKKTKGMFLIHVMGYAPDMDHYTRFCNEHGLVLLEDACESVGAHFGGKHVGTFGRAGSFSLYYSHHVSSIEGGVVITDDLALYDDLKSIRAHGWVRDRSDKDAWLQKYPDIDPRFLFIMTGYNVRPTEIQAAIATVQLDRLDAMLAARENLARDVAVWAQQAVPWLRLIGRESLEADRAIPGRRGRRHSWMTLPFEVAADAPLSLGQVKDHLEHHGVETRPIIAGNLTRHPAVQRLECRCAKSLAKCDGLLARGFMIGCHPVAAPGAIETLHRAIEGLGKL